MKVGKQLSSRQAELRARINRTRTKKRVHVLPLNSTKKSDNRPEQGSDPTTLLEDINAAQPIEDLAYYPTVWKCLQFTPVLSQPGKDFLESMDISSRINQNRPYRAALNFARLNDAVPFEQDPIHESDDDEDTCQECHQGWKRIIQSDEEILMQCAVFDRREKRSHGCGLWWHVGCVNRSEQPKGNWLCFACSLNLGVDNLEVNSTGLEVEASDDEETQPTPPKKRARSNTAAKPRTFRKSTRVLRSSKTDDAFELDTSEDEDEEPVPPPKRRRKSPPVAKKPSKNDDDDDAEEVYNEWETHSRPQTRSSGRKKEPKKRELDDDQAKKPSPENANVKTEPKKKKKKTWIPRAAGMRPTKAIHQIDAKTREKLEALQKPMEVLQAMTLPFYRSDEYTPPANENDIPQEAIQQSHWPWVIHGSFCFTNQKANDDAAKQATHLARPQLNLWVGSRDAAGHVAKHFRDMKKEGYKGFKVNIHSSFDSYYDSFRSDSGRNKPAPPRPETPKEKKAPPKEKKAPPKEKKAPPKEKKAGKRKSGII